MSKTDTAYLSIDDVAAILGVHHNTVYRFIKSGKLPAKIIKRKYCIPYSSVSAYQAKQSLNAEYLNISQVAEILGVCRETASNCVQSGEILGVKVGRSYRISRTAVADYQANHAALYDCNAVAEILGISRQAVQNLINSGKLSTTQVKPKYLMSMDDINAYLSQTTVDSDDYLTVPDVAELLNVSDTTVRRYIVSGKIPARLVKHSYMISKDDIAEYQAQHQSAPESSQRP